MADSNQFLALLDQEKPKIINMLPPESDDRARERWWTFIYELSRNASLRTVADKNPMSLLNALYKFADWGLVPDGDEGFINVYNTKQDDGSWLPEASPEPMYKGMIRRGIDAGIITHCVADVLREGDTMQSEIGAKGRLLTVNPAPAQKGRKLTGAYALFWLPSGLMDYELFDEDDIAAVENASLRNAQRRNKDAKLSPAWQFFRGEMAKAKVLKRGLKRMRGKRDTDAGHRFADMISADDTRFDAETTGDELTHVDDDMPTAARKVDAELVDDKANGKKKGVAEAAGVKTMEDRPVTMSEADELSTQAESAGLVRRQIRPVLKQFGVEEFEELRVSQIGDVAKALNVAAEAARAAQ
jgi:recombinational DNA repair protein RecT